jgi:hypothetical protein
MNEALRELALKAGGGLSCIAEPLEHPWKFSERELEKFAELIVRECMRESMAEIIDDEDIATETDPLIREYLLGNNQGIVDAVVRFRNHFGVTE